MALLGPLLGILENLNPGVNQGWVIWRSYWGRSASYSCTCWLHSVSFSSVFYSHPRTFFSLLLEREKKGKREASIGSIPFALGLEITHSQTGDVSLPDWESNPATFQLQNNAPANCSTPARAAFSFLWW